MNRFNRLAAIAVASLVAMPVSAQVLSSAQSVSLTATLGAFVTLGTPSPTSQSMTLTNGTTNIFSSPFTISVSWNVVDTNATHVKLVGWFATPAAAFTNGTDNIASSLVSVSSDAGATWTTCNGAVFGTVGVANGSCVIYDAPTTSGATRVGSHTVNFLVRIDLSASPSLSSGAYTATMNLRAVDF